MAQLRTIQPESEDEERMQNWEFDIAMQTYQVIRKKDYNGRHVFQDLENYTRCSDRTESYRKKIFRETKEMLERYDKKICGTAGKWS